MFTVQVNWENWCSLESPGSSGLGHGEEAIFNHLNHQPSPARELCVIGIIAELSHLCWASERCKKKAVLKMAPSTRPQAKQKYANPY